MSFKDKTTAEWSGDIDYSIVPERVELIDLLLQEDPLVWLAEAITKSPKSGSDDE